MSRSQAPVTIAAMAGVAWMGAAAATGQRYAAPTLRWLLPALLAATVAAVLTLALPKLLLPGRPARAGLATTWLSAPLLLAWPAIGLLLTSSEANHYFVNWPRVRVGALAVVALPEALILWTLGVAALQARWRRRPVLSDGPRIFLGIFLAYAALSGGHLYSADEWTIYATASGLAHHLVPAAYANQPYPLHVLGTVGGADVGDRGREVPRAFTKYGMPPSLVAAPLVAVADLVGPGTSLPAAHFPFENRAAPLVPLLYGPAVGAATAALLFVVCRRLGYSRRGSAVAALALAAGSLELVYAKTLMNMPLAGLWLLLAYWLVIPGTSDSPRISRLLLAGAAAGLAAATRYELSISSPLVLLLAVGPSLRRRRIVSTVREAAAFSGGLLLVALPLVLGYNLLRTGSWLSAGYGAEGTLSGVLARPWYGWFAVLLAPGCGLVAYTPLMALGLVGLAWLWNDHRPMALVCAALSGLAVVYYGSLETTWCAYATWGPRYFVSVAPFMALPLAAMWDRLDQRPRVWRNPFVLATVGGCAAWSVFTNLLAALIDFNRGWQDHYAAGVTAQVAAWVPYHSLITTHFRLLRQWVLDGTGGLDLYLLYAAPWTPILWGIMLLGAWAALQTVLMPADGPAAREMA